MRILMVIPSINLLTGGPANSTVLRARELAARGHHVQLFSTLWPELGRPVEETIEQNGLQIKLFPAVSLPGLSHVPYSKALVVELTQVLHEFEVVHVASLWNPLITRVMMILRRRRVPYVLTPHGMMDPIVFSRHWIGKTCWAWLFERRNVESASLVIFTSEGEESKAKARGWRIPKSLVLPNVIELSQGQNLPPRNQIELKYPQLNAKEVVAFVGRINWVKNLEILVAAIARLRARGRDVALLCAGPDTDGYQAGLERLADDLGMHDAVVFTGMLEGKELLAAFARADTLALVSQKENFGRAAAEALAAGVPVVLSDGVDLGKHWPAPPVWRVQQNSDSIADGLNAALDYSRVAGLPANKARNLAQQEWGNSYIESLISSYQTIVSERA